jgi:hypothetical protein
VPYIRLWRAALIIYCTYLYITVSGRTNGTLIEVHKKPVGSDAGST